jgi:hypothetical protein
MVAVFQQEEVHGQRDAVVQYSSVAVCVLCQFAAKRSMCCGTVQCVVL